MDLTLTKESYGGSKLSWLGSRHGVGNARTVTIDRTKIIAGDVTAGFIPAGTPLAKSGDKVAPYTAAEGEVLVGFLLTDQAVKAGGGDVVGPLVWHGLIKVAKLPVAFTAPTNATAFTFI